MTSKGSAADSSNERLVFDEVYRVGRRLKLSRLTAERHLRVGIRRKRSIREALRLYSRWRLVLMALAFEIERLVEGGALTPMYRDGQIFMLSSFLRKRGVS
jgi:hypothetical protein